MAAEETEITPQNYFLQPGYIYVSQTPVLVSTVVGSCIAVLIYDRKHQAGGINHFRYPFTRDHRQATAVFGNVATVALINMLIENGAQIKHLEAQIIGGAFNPDVSTQDVGRENIRVARRVLARKAVRVVSEDVGGRQGRKVVFNTRTNEVAVLKVDRLRLGDWAPYEEDR